MSAWKREGRRIKFFSYLGMHLPVGSCWQVTNTGRQCGIDHDDCDLRSYSSESLTDKTNGDKICVIKASIIGKYHLFQVLLLL